MSDPSDRPPDTVVPSPGEGETAMFCTACGTRNATDANFCKQCGQKMGKSVPPHITDEEFALPRTDDERAKDLLLAAFQHSAAGDLEAATQACAQALELKPNSTDAHSLMSTLYEKQGKLDKAIAERERVLELNPGSIADREKLGNLKDGARPGGLAKVTSAHRAQPARKPSVFDTPGGAALAALCAALLVLVVGGAIVWAQSARSHRMDAAQKPAGTPPTQVAQVPPSAAAGSGVMPTSTATPQTQSVPRGVMTFRPAPTAPYVPDAARGGRQAANTAGMEPRTGREIGPAPVTFPERRFDEPDRRPGEPPSGTNTVHLPDNGAVTPDAGASPPNTAAGTPPRRNGQIHVEIAPGPGATTGAPAGDAAPGGSGGSQQQLQLARQVQMQGNYRAAIRAYIKALDGAGDASAEIHQQLGLCHQRLDERESAVAEYSQAITEYKQQVGAGRNADAANRGIRACEQGIRACQ